MAQAKDFVERRHKTTMANMVACLNREMVTRWDIINKRLDSIIIR